MQYPNLPGLLALCAALTLSACDAVNPLSGPKQVSVLGGSLQVGAPNGYCISPAASQQAANTAVVLIGRCTAEGRVQAALVTVTIGRPASAGVMLAGTQALAAYFASPAGRKALSRDGRLNDVGVIQTVSTENAVLLHVLDRVAGDYWRAVTGLNGRLVTVSANATERAPLTAAQGRKLVEDTLFALHQANPAKPAVPLPALAL